MANLKKTASGHLMKNAAGHLVKACEEAPQNTCNSCDPALRDTIPVTIAGLQGDLAIFNGEWDLEWIGGCTWRVGPYVPGGDREIIQLASVGTGALQYWTANVRVLHVALGQDCRKSWKTNPGAGYACAPWDDTFSELACEGPCLDTDSCADSAGATFVVNAP